VRREQPKKTKVGHAGTLDPFATGLLLVLVGKATRAQRFLMGLPKTYRAVARLGWTSTTGDPEGELTQTRRIPDDPQIETGEIMQRPHAFSAVKVGGKRAYELARAGEEPELEARPVTVYRAERLSLEGDRAEFEIECSAGTYVRQLVAALDDAYCEELERTQIGDFKLSDADPDRLLPLNEALTFLPERALSEDEAQRVSHGGFLSLPPQRGQSTGSDPFGTTETYVRLISPAGELIAIGRQSAEEIRPDIVFVT
jgi:tRNA pseudouridine55 synthase